MARGLMACGEENLETDAVFGKAQQHVPLFTSGYPRPARCSLATSFRRQLAGVIPDFGLIGAV
jgi:hypothetical protein